jgi:hypothetical protein
MLQVTLGGSICTELLSNQGWNPMYRLEQILVDVSPRSPRSTAPLPGTLLTTVPVTVPVPIFVCVKSL